MIVGTSESQRAAGGEGGQYLSRPVLATLLPPRWALPAANRCSAAARGARAPPPPADSTLQSANLGQQGGNATGPRVAEP